MMMGEYTDIVMGKDDELFSLVNCRCIRLKIVQIGTGGWGKNHTRILAQLRGI